MRHPEKQGVQHLVPSTQWMLSESLLNQIEKAPRVNSPGRISTVTQPPTSPSLPP